MKTRIMILLVSIVALLLFPNDAKACSCAELTPCQAFGYSTAVFVGRMIEGTEKVGEYTRDGKKISREAGVVRFAVEEAFKGVNTTEIRVSALKGMCAGYSFVRGERYLVYAGYSDSSGLIIGWCSPTKRIERAEADLQFLRSLPEPGAGGRLYGQVYLYTGSENNPPLSDITIIAEDEMQRRIETKTNSTGNYEFSGLKPGKYIVSPVLSENYVLKYKFQKKYEVPVFDRGCTPYPFWISVDGRISGRVTDSTGRPALADLTLVSVEQPERAFGGSSSEDGRYEIDEIFPGRYALYVELRIADKEEPYFYPGVSDISQATIIKIGMAEKLSGYNFQLPPKLQLKIVQGVVTYSDGQPAANVDVKLIFDDDDNAGVYRTTDTYISTMTDALGHFTLYGYKDLTCEITAHDMRVAIEEKRKPRKAEPMPLILKTDMIGIKVVIPLENGTGESQPSQKRKNAP